MNYLNAGANGRDRTDDLLITNELLYQLSYIGAVKRAGIKPKAAGRVKFSGGSLHSKKPGASASGFLTGRRRL